MEQMDMPLEAAVFNQAKLLFEQHKYVESKNLFLSLLRGEEKLDYLYYIGLIYLNQKEYSEASEVFSKCLKLDSKNFNYSYYLGVIAENQNDADLALYYYKKTLQLNSTHTNSRMSLARLTATQKQLTNLQYDSALPETDKLNFSQQATESPASLSKIDEQLHSHYAAASHDLQPKAEAIERNNNPETLIAKEPTQLYDELVASTDKDSQIAVEMLKATSIIMKRPRLSAYLGTILIRTILLPVILIALLLMVGNFLLKFNLSHLSMHTVLSTYVFLGLISLIYTIVKIKLIIVTLDRGFFELTTGVFSRTKLIFLNHKADHFATHQNLLNQITGDCTLLFDLDSGHQGKVKLTGLGKISEINALAKNLQTLRYQLRNTPVIKSGIFG